MSDTSFMYDLADLFDRTVTIEPFALQTAAGKPTYGAAVTYAARVIMKDVGVRTVEGTTIIGKGTIYLPGVYVVTTRDRLTLPAGILSPSQPPILSVSVSDDEMAGSYTTLVIG
jgi:hypothetical protein